jgi:hypothetical protein
VCTASTYVCDADADAAELCVQDRKRSDSMDPACNAGKLNGLLRHAIKIMKGLKISLIADSFQVSVISVLPLLKITER